MYITPQNICYGYSFEGPHYMRTHNIYFSEDIKISVLCFVEKNKNKKHPYLELFGSYTVQRLSVKLSKILNRVHKCTCWSEFSLSLFAYDISEICWSLAYIRFFSVVDFYSHV